ncbi:glucose-6-phosphate isomerase [Rhodomicrobium sp.]|uniref:glucose-6-phosphate isomerase n=1 Tax=Rhodomicrobium sp. TaxID=2720632 RepID=UPI0039E28B70
MTSHPSYRQSIEGSLSTKIGDAGLSRGRLTQWLTLLTPRFKALEEAAQADSFAHFRILKDTADIEETRAAYDKLAAGAETVVILGTGGSSLGGQALAQVGGWGIPGDDGDAAGKLPELRFCDNLDSRSFTRGLLSLDIPKTRFIAISKSGTTGETLSQVLIAFKFIEDAGHAALIPQIFLGVTEPAKPGVANGLRELFSARGIPLLPHPTDIGGRYSAFSVVGLLPALARGLDVAAFRAGALDVVKQLSAATMPEDHPAAVGAALSIGLAKDLGVTNSVLMPYSDRLERFSAWYVQLWAESLGKNGEGTTPIGTLGPVDQHSQLQLFMDGPATHLMTIVRVAEAEGADRGLTIPAALAAEAGAPYLAEKSIGDLVAAQQKAIVDALIEAKRPVRTIDVPKLDERALGALMMHFFIETILAGDLLGVDPFDQPAVELAKKLTRQYLAA